MCAEFKEHEPSSNIISFTGPNAGSFTWNIIDKNLIQNILNAPNKQKFESKPFTIAQLQWILQLYPNGSRDDNKGSVKVYLKLLAMPAGLDSIICSRVISYNQTFANHSYISTFNKSGHRLGVPDGLLILEWQSLISDKLAISVAIRILQLGLKKESNFLRISRLGSYLQHQNIANKTYTNDSEYVYIVDQALLNSMKRWPWGKGVSSNIFDNLWQIVVHPGGKNEMYKDNVCVMLQLCNIPPFVKSIKVNWKIKCDQTYNSIFDTKTYDIMNQSDGEFKLMTSSKLGSLNGLSFTLNISILEVTFENDENKLLNTIYDQTEIKEVLSTITPSNTEEQKMNDSAPSQEDFIR